MTVPQATIQAERERLYESSSLRDDLNDAEAMVLLNWGEKQVERLAGDYPTEFEQKSRFLRQLMKHINRFVGQREFNDAVGQREYLGKVVKYLEPLGWSGITEEHLMRDLPSDAKDMNGTLQAVLKVLGGDDETASEAPINEAPMASLSVIALLEQATDGLLRTAPTVTTSEADEATTREAVAHEKMDLPTTQASNATLTDEDQAPSTGVDSSNEQ